MIDIQRPFDLVTAMEQPVHDGPFVQFDCMHPRYIQGSAVGGIGKFGTDPADIIHDFRQSGHTGRFIPAKIPVIGSTFQEMRMGHCGHAVTHPAHTESALAQDLIGSKAAGIDLQCLDIDDAMGNMLGAVQQDIKIRLYPARFPHDCFHIIDGPDNIGSLDDGKQAGIFVDFGKQVVDIDSARLFVDICRAEFLAQHLRKEFSPVMGGGMFQFRRHDVGAGNIPHDDTGHREQRLGNRQFTEDGTRLGTENQFGVVQSIPDHFGKRPCTGSRPGMEIRDPIDRIRKLTDFLQCGRAAGIFKINPFGRLIMVDHINL